MGRKGFCTNEKNTEPQETPAIPAGTESPAPGRGAEVSVQTTSAEGRTFGSTILPQSRRQVTHTEHGISLPLFCSAQSRLRNVHIS